MNYTLRKQINRLLPILKNSYRHDNNIKRSIICSTKNNSSNLIQKTSYIAVFNQLRMVSSSNLAKSNDSHANENGSKDEPNKNVIDDEEFKSILSDFANDFGVNSDSEQILEDIRKSIDDSLTEDSQAASQDQVQNYSASHENVKCNPVTKNKFKEFSESDAVVIPSYEEYQPESESEESIYHIDQPRDFKFSSEELKRGVHGVFDIDDLIKVLRKENLLDITAISIPEELHYTDFLVLATAKSLRHSKAVCENVIKLYKMKKHFKDPFLIVEGDKGSKWKAIDMGNIVLHVFLGETRTLYDIESLWLFDPDFDKSRFKKLDPLYDAIEEHMAFFNALNTSTSATSEK